MSIHVTPSQRRSTRLPAATLAAAIILALPATAVVKAAGPAAAPAAPSSSGSIFETLSDAMVNELSPTDASGDTNKAFNANVSLANDYWFRYSDLGHNRLNVPLILGSAVHLGQSVALYSRFSTDYSEGLGNSPAYSTVGTGTKTVTTGAGSYTAPISSSGYGGWVNTLTSDAKTIGDFPMTSLAVGLRVAIAKAAVVELGVADFVSPLPGAQYTISAKGPVGSTVRATMTAIGLTNTVEGYGQVSLNDTWMGYLAMHPYLYFGFDYNYTYQGTANPSTSGTGEYMEVGLRPSYRVPGLECVKINPFASSSFIFSQRRAETNGTTGTGYLGSTVGLSLNFSITRAFNIPHRNGDVSLGVYGEEVMASNRFVDTLYGGTVHSDAAVGGVYFAFGF